MKSASQERVRVAVKVWQLSALAMVRFCIVMGEHNALWVSDRQGFTIPGLDHKWKQFRQPQDRPEE